jgi:hypothetical protein
VIHASLRDGNPVLSTDLPPGATAFVDAEWVITDAQEPIPALVGDSAGQLRWCDGPPVAVPEGLDSGTAAGLALVDLARTAAAAVDANPRDGVEVEGEGIVARLVRALLPAASARAAGKSAQVAAVIDTTGDPSRIEAATRRLSDLGTLVLAGEAVGRRLALELYPDVHLRGLRVVGVGAPLQAGVLPSERAADEELSAMLRSTLCGIRSGMAGVRGAAWFAVSS